MTYNIWNGFDWGKDTERQTKFIDWIKSKDPDVLALQELCGYTEEKLKADAAKWGHPYSKILKTKGYPVGLTSKKPIVLKERALDSLWHGMLHCKTYGIDFFVVHLSPADANFRLKEAGIISEKIKAAHTDTFMVLGDFNAHSPFDGEALKHNKSLLQKYAKGESDKYSNLRLGTFDFAPISTFLGLPSIDLSKNFNDVRDRFTYPSPVLMGSYRENMEEVILTRERIDYILSSPVISKSCIGVTTYNSGETEALSDHFPIMAEFDFSQKE
ncbi:endonuclease/exonuclease/phosphatase family protein [Flagellimonas myxillae]|uniref:endonuclease/exonuclease/phosphatase family protein n=1 Tax=Flagellimonas myxillae TaxID=2942214 RepID=UPI00201F4D7E|nr:endonuclease/exonuclease/phosphatase family protein [Muricauda myxillae]MCL6265742.1 endonuclease/exonuclease/phosphatase family protein [Muricauda myxillae]